MKETDEPDSPRSSNEAADSKSRAGAFLKLQEYAFRKFPSLVRDPNYRSRLEIWRRGDEEDNARTTPPQDERIGLHCIWVIEFYTPSNIENLLNGLNTLGWAEKDSVLRGYGDDIMAWVQQFRERSGGEGWLNLGAIYPPKSSLPPGHRRTAPLPPQFRYALGEIHCLTSSITCVVMGFVLEEEGARQLDVALRRSHQTLLERREHGLRIHRPEQLKAADIQAMRTDLRSAAANWFCTHLPGLFSSDLLDGEFPTCELLTLRKASPFPKRGKGTPGPRDYLRLLNVHLGFSVWECVGTPALRFSWPLPHGDENRFHAIVAAREADFDEADLGRFGGPNTNGYVNYIEKSLTGLLSRWALVALLSGFERHLNAVRDSAVFRRTRGDDPLALLGALEGLVSRSVDIAAISSELVHLTDQESSLVHEIEFFKPLDTKFHGGEHIKLGEALRDLISERAARLEVTDRSVRDLLVQYGALIGASGSIQVQRSLGRFTLAIAAVTLLALVVAVAGNDVLSDYAVKTFRYLTPSP